MPKATKCNDTVFQLKKCICLFKLSHNQVLDVFKRQKMSKIQNTIGSTMSILSVWICSSFGFWKLKISAPFEYLKFLVVWVWWILIVRCLYLNNPSLGYMFNIFSHFLSVRFTKMLTCRLRKKRTVLLYYRLQIANVSKN